MEIIRNAFGLVLIFLAWFNPLSFGLPIQIALLILGFDAIGIIVKLLLFILNLFFPLLGSAGSFLTLTLLLLMVVEILISLLGSISSLILIVKPVIIFITIFFGMGNIQLALIIAGLDLILNLKH